MNETLGIKGTAFPLQFDHRGKLKTSADHQHIRESIKQILLTKRGSIPFKPEFGSRIPNRVFDSVNTGALIKADAEQALAQWEKRIESVNITLIKGENMIPGKIRFKVTYKIKGIEELQELIETVRAA